MDKTAVTVLSLMAGIIVVICVIRCSDGIITKGVNGKDGSKYEVAMIDGCEYIVSYGYCGLPTYAHKGNCTNSIHIYREVK